jgi:hypothetical protein
MSIKKGPLITGGIVIGRLVPLFDHTYPLKSKQPLPLSWGRLFFVITIIIVFGIRGVYFLKEGNTNLIYYLVNSKYSFGSSLSSPFIYVLTSLLFSLSKLILPIKQDSATSGFSSKIFK